MLSVVALLLLVTVGDVHSAKQITCAAPSVQEGDPANITCFFNEDVSLTKKNIKVQRRPPNSQTFDPDTVDTVVDCYWLNADDFKCNVADNFKLLGAVGKTATVGISHAGGQHEGKYMCEIVPSDPSEIEACDFRLKDEKGPEIVTVPVPGQCREQIDAVYSGVVVIILLIALLVLGLTIFVLFYFRDRLLGCLHTCPCSRRPKQEAKKPNTEKTPLEETHPLSEDETKSLLKKEKKQSAVPKPDKRETIVPSPDVTVSPPADDGRDKTETRVLDKSTETVFVWVISAEEAMSDRLHLSVDEHYRRIKEEFKRRFYEHYAREKLEGIRMRNQEERNREQEIERSGPVLTDKQSKERREREKKRTDEESKAAAELERIKRENAAARLKQQDEDQQRMRKVPDTKRSSTGKGADPKQQVLKPTPAQHQGQSPQPGPEQSRTVTV